MTTEERILEILKTIEIKYKDREFILWLYTKKLSYSKQKFYQVIPHSDGKVTEFTLTELYAYWQLMKLKNPSLLNYLPIGRKRRNK
jgi:hypothetical protein